MSGRVGAKIAGVVPILDDMDRTGDGFDPYNSSFGVAYGTVGVILLVIGGALLANINEDPTIFGAGGTLFLASGLYLTNAGAVARGIQLARR
jgi:hypothetical protein